MSPLGGGAGSGMSAGEDAGVKAVSLSTFTPRLARARPSERSQSWTLTI